jgi:hypothetical protein
MNTPPVVFAVWLLHSGRWFRVAVLTDRAQARDAERRGALVLPLSDKRLLVEPTGLTVAHAADVPGGPR